MTTLQDPRENDNNIEFVGIVGKAGPRQTAQGKAIDVADNRVRPCVWVDVVPDDPDIVDVLSCGDVVKIRGTVLMNSKRPLVRGKVEILRHRQRGNPR